MRAGLICAGDESGTHPEARYTNLDHGPRVTNFDMLEIRRQLERVIVPVQVTQPPMDRSLSGFTLLAKHN